MSHEVVHVVCQQTRNENKFHTTLNRIREVINNICNRIRRLKKKKKKKRAHDLSPNGKVINQSRCRHEISELSFKEASSNLSKTIT